MNFSSFNSFKRANFIPKFAKSFYKNSNQFKMFSQVNPQSKVINFKNLLFAQNIYHITKVFTNLTHHKMTQLLKLAGESKVENTNKEEDTGIIGLNNCENSLLNQYNNLCEGNN